MVLDDSCNFSSIGGYFGGKVVKGGVIRKEAHMFEPGISLGCGGFEIDRHKFALGELLLSGVAGVGDRFFFGVAFCGAVGDAEDGGFGRGVDLDKDLVLHGGVGCLYCRRSIYEICNRHGSAGDRIMPSVYR
jgi:hypothetical protein